MESAPSYPNRLGKNERSYQGETIDIAKLLKDVEEIAASNGWERRPLEVSAAQTLPGFWKVAENARKRLYISTGMHGDEPAGPLALLRLFEENDWPRDVSLYVIPCFNPGGFIKNTRENEDGIDLNRDYREMTTALVRAHARWLEATPWFDVSACLHEDWEAHGFYLYELNPSLRGSLSERIIERVKEVCPIDPSLEIEGREAKGGIICANRYLVERPDWPEAFYLIHHKSPISYTLEAPSDFPLLTRVNALAAGTRAVLEAV